MTLSKCKFAQTQVPFVGYIVGSGSYSPDPRKTETIAHLKAPQTKTELRHVLGVMSFYRSHVQDYARIAKLSDRGTCVLTTCPGLHSIAERPGFELATY